MIVGIGTDVVSIARVNRIALQFGDRLANKVLSGVELEEYKHSGKTAAFVARRFAAKEAAAKALGTGFASGVSKKDIQVGHDNHGKPLLIFTGAALRVCQNMGVARSWLSISDEKDYAIAFVVLESG